VWIEITLIALVIGLCNS